MSVGVETLPIPFCRTQITVGISHAHGNVLLGAFSPPSTDDAKMNAFTKWTEDNKLPPHKVKIGAAPGHRLEATEQISEGEIMLSGEHHNPTLLKKSYFFASNCERRGM